MRDLDNVTDIHESRRRVSERRDSRSWSRRQALASLASVGTLALAGCSLASLTPGVEPRWERDFPDAVAAGPPAATDENVVVGGQDKRLHGFTADGERIFEVETGGPIETRPATPTSGGPFHAHSTDGDLYTVGVSGEQRWQVEGRTENGWLSRLGSLLIHLDPVDDTVTGYDARSGTRRFRRSGRAYPLPTLSEAVCIIPVTTSDDRTKLVTLAPETGEVLWESPPRELIPYVVAAGDRIVTVRESTVRMRRASDGHVLWRTEVAGDVTSSFGTPVWLDERVHVGVRHDGGPDELVAVDRDGGTVQWRRTVGYELETVTATEQGVFVASSVDDPDGGIVIRLDAFSTDGTRRWQATTDIAIGGTAQAFGRTGEILYAASDNALAAYDPDDGTRRWRYDPESSRIGVTATGSALYVSTRDSGGVARLPTE